MDQTEAPQQGVDAAQWLAMAPSLNDLSEMIDSKARAELAQLVLTEYEIDRDSGDEWRERCDKGLDLADMVTVAKTYPWPDAANIKFPLIMQAAIEFNAQAYPALVPPGDIVKVPVNGADPGGMKAARAARVSEHMSYQLRHKIDGWEGATDKLLMQLAIVGTMFRKTWPDPATGRICSKVCKPGSVIVNDAVASLETAPRVSEEFALYPHEIIERQRARRFREGDWVKAGDGKETNDSQATQDFIEQHRRHDLDGDGYPEPYVVTVHKASQEVVRIAANWSPADVIMGQDGVLSVPPTSYYTDYHFMPAVRGGFHSAGFGVLLGDLSEAINASINLLIDSAHKQMLGSGWIGAEARLKGGPQPLKPGEYRHITAMGGDLRQAIVPEPNGGASPVLFNLLGMLVQAAQSLANTKDIQDASQRSNQPATTVLALIEVGMTIYSAIFKRVHRSMKREFTQIAGFNAEMVSPEEYQTFHDEPADPRFDYNLDDMDIEPSADPRSVTSQQKIAKAQLLREMGATGEVDRTAATMRVLDAAGIPDTEELMPQPDPAAVAMAEAQSWSLMLANIETSLRIAEIEAKITKMDAEAIKTLAEAEAADPMNPINVARMQLEELKVRLTNVRTDGRSAGSMAGGPGNGNGAGGAAQGGGAPQGGDPGGMLGIGGGGSAPMGLGASVY